MCTTHINLNDYKNPIGRKREAQMHKESAERRGTLRVAKTESEKSHNSNRFTNSSVSYKVRDTSPSVSVATKDYV